MSFSEGLRGRAVRSTGTMQLTVLLLVFFVGAILFVTRFASAATTTMTIEAENMTPSNTSVVQATNRSDASGSRTAYMTGPANVKATRSTGRITNVAVRAGTYIDCSGTIRMQVLIDGKVSIDKYLSNYYPCSTYNAPVDIPAGSHEIFVAFVSGPSCYKELWVDKVDLTVDQPTQPTGQPIALGAWNQGVPWDLTNLNSYVSEVGRKPAMVLWFQSWGPISDGTFCKSCAQNLQSQGYKQMVTWEPQDYHYGANQPSYNLDSIINGSHDAYIKRYADDIKSSGVPVYLRPMHEMNGDWYPWGAGMNGNTPDKYKRAWVHIYDIFQQEGATNVKWVWSPNVGQPGWSPAHSMSSFYPGDAYVDWLALDGYNWSSVHSDPWRSFDQTFSGSYSEITSVAPNKPLMVAETASEEKGGDKAQWTKDLESVVKSKYPKIKALIWFNQYADGANWPVDSSQTALSAYRQLVADPYFQGAMP